MAPRRLVTMASGHNTASLHSMQILMASIPCTRATARAITKRCHRLDKQLGHLPGHTPQVLAEDSAPPTCATIIALRSPLYVSIPAHHSFPLSLHMTREQWPVHMPALACTHLSATILRPQRLLDGILLPQPTQTAATQPSLRTKHQVLSRYMPLPHITMGPRERKAFLPSYTSTRSGFSSVLIICYCLFFRHRRLWDRAKSSARIILPQIRLSSGRH